ncbi:MAG: Gfo/Idh/MocA family oxidoreductase [Planctomycetes bacterium]|nr:Gfo/Idh/MocA family oxidoreductase [Planctomycetota bacterium]
MAKTLKIGFIGSGGIAGTHMKHLSQVDGVVIAAASDVSRRALDNVRQTYGVERTFTDWKEMLRKVKDLDAVSVCTPNSLHLQPTLDALKAGKHVLVEKPLAMNAREGQRMVDAARKARRILMIAFQWRFTPAAQAVRKLVAQGALGDILYVRCQALRRRGIPNWGVFGRKDLQGGGPMIDIGVHIMEQAHYVMGKPVPVAATGAVHTYLGNRKSQALCKWDHWDYKTYTVEDLAVGMVSFDNGARLTIEASFAAHIEHDVFNVQLMGTKGGATLDPVKVFTDQNGLMVNIEPAFVGNWDAFKYKMEHFVDCVRGDAVCDSPAEDGLMVQKMIDGVYESAAKGREVVIR